jgi:putative flippase GtrA
MSLLRKDALTGRVIRYGIAGVFATVVYSGVVFALVEFAGLKAVPAAVGATLVVIMTSYIVNRRWVFDTDRSHTSAFSRFVAASMVSICLNTGLMHVAVNFFGWRYAFGVLLTVVVVPPINFVVNYLWAFRPQRT